MLFSDIEKTALCHVLEGKEVDINLNVQSVISLWVEKLD